MNTEKAKILIVDDDMDIITVMETILEKEGYTVITAGSKAEALNLAKVEKPNIAILDVMMSTHYEGFELANAMLNDPELSEIPVLIQTSIDVFVTNNPSVQQMAREYRKDPQYKDLQVLLIKNVQSGNAGVDYRDEEGKSIWVKVNGFLRKPVDPSKLLPEVEKLLA
jgi:twitching motility two-component system response regulator PilH